MYFSNVSFKSHGQRFTEVASVHDSLNPMENHVILWLTLMCMGSKSNEMAKYNVYQNSVYDSLNPMENHVMRLILFSTPNQMEWPKLSIVKCIKIHTAYIRMHDAGVKSCLIKLKET